VTDRPVTVTILLVGLIPAFVVTSWLVDCHKRTRRELAREWTERGQRDLSQDARLAVTDFTTARSFAPADRTIRFRLATALLRANRPAEAKVQLLTLHAEDSRDGGINRELGRLAARTGDTAEAVRYLDAAVDGTWPTGADADRRETAIELARLFLATHQLPRAQAALIAITRNLPREADAVTTVGRLLSEAGADARALTTLKEALKIDPEYAPAATSIGLIEFRQRDYRIADEYLRRARDNDRLDREAATALRLSDLIITLDPSTAGLTARERVRRVVADVAIARRHLSQCSGPAPTIAVTADLRSRLDAFDHLRTQAVTENSARIDDAMSAVFDAELAAQQTCGTVTDDDRALVRLAGAPSIPRDNATSTMPTAGRQ